MTPLTVHTDYIGVTVEIDDQGQIWIIGSSGREYFEIFVGDMI